MEINQYEVWLINLDPTLGYEIKKTRPCVIISPNEMNKFLGTCIIAPMTTNKKIYPSRVSLTFERKNASIILDQIRTVDKQRFIKKLGTIKESSVLKLKAIIQEMLVA